MKFFWERNKARFIIFLAVLGPGLITAMADNDAAGVATYSVAASMYGMSSQYFVVLTTILLGVTQEIGARIAIVTGKGLGDLIRENYGVRISVVLFAAYFVANQSVILQNVAGLKSAVQLFDLPMWLAWMHWQGLLVVVCTALILAVVFLNFKNLQRIFLVTILFYGTYIVSALLVKPDWGEALRRSLIFPERHFVANPHYWFTLIAVLGTTVTAWGQFFINSFVADKGIKPEQLKEQRAEVFFGAILTNVFSWMMAIAVTYTLFAHNTIISDAQTAAMAIRPLAGNFSYILFATGLLAASLLGLIVVPLATAYVFTELFGYERSLNSTFGKGRVFYTFFILQIVLGLLASLFPQINLFGLTLYANYLNGAILPVIFYFLIRFSENPEIMGETYISKGFSKWFLRGAALFIAIAVVVTFVGQFI